MVIRVGFIGKISSLTANVILVKSHGKATIVSKCRTNGCLVFKRVRKRRSVCFTKCFAKAGSASCSSLLMFSLSLSGVRPGVKPGVAAPLRGVIPPPA